MSNARHPRKEEEFEDPNNTVTLPKWLHNSSCSPSEWIKFERMLNRKTKSSSPASEETMSCTSLSTRNASTQRRISVSTTMAPWKFKTNDLALTREVNITTPTMNYLLPWGLQTSIQTIIQASLQASIQTSLQTCHQTIHQIDHLLWIFSLPRTVQNDHQSTRHLHNG